MILRRSSILWLLTAAALGLTACDCGGPQPKPDGGIDAGSDAGSDGGMDGGACVDGGCIECTLDQDCATRSTLCSSARCSNFTCVFDRHHDGDGGFLSVPELSPETRLSTGSATPIAAAWNGTEFLVAFQQAGVDVTELKKIRLDGGSADAFLLPSSLKLLAANDTLLLGVFETISEGVSAQLISPSGTPIGVFPLEGIANNQPRAAGVAASPNGFLVNWDYYNGRANSLAMVSNTAVLTLGVPLKPGLTDYSHAGRSAWNGSTFVLAWEDQQERPADPEIWAATITAQAVASPALGLPSLRSDPDGGSDYFAPELVNVAGKLMLLANTGGQKIAIAPLDATLTAASPLLLPASDDGGSRPLATHDGANLVVLTANGLRRVTPGAINLDLSPVPFATAALLANAALATDGAGHLLIAYQRDDGDGGTTGAFSRVIRTCP